MRFSHINFVSHILTKPVFQRLQICIRIIMNFKSFNQNFLFQIIIVISHLYASFSLKRFVSFQYHYKVTSIAKTITLNIGTFSKWYRLIHWIKIRAVTTKFGQFKLISQKKKRKEKKKKSLITVSSLPHKYYILENPLTV